MNISTISQAETFNSGEMYAELSFKFYREVSGIIGCTVARIFLPIAARKSERCIFGERFRVSATSNEKFSITRTNLIKTGQRRSRQLALRHPLTPVVAASIYLFETIEHPRRNSPLALDPPARNDFIIISRPETPRRRSSCNRGRPRRKVK